MDEQQPQEVAQEPPQPAASSHAQAAEGQSHTLSAQPSRPLLQPDTEISPQSTALQSPVVRTANTTPIPSPSLFSPGHDRPNMAAPPPQAASEGTTPLGMPNSTYLHPLQGHKVRETHKALVDTDVFTGRKMINAYEIIDELGRGVHGKVKLARNTETGENVAIKIIPRFSKKRRLGKITTFGTHDKVKREIAILKKIRHPNVVALLEVIDDPELKKIYMVLEHVELGEVVWRKKGLPHICAYERRRVEREMHGNKATAEEERYDRLVENRQALKDRKRAKISQGQPPLHEYWSLEYGAGAPDEDELELIRTRVPPNRDDLESVARSIPSNPGSNVASRGTSRAPSRSQSARSLSRIGTPQPPGTRDYEEDLDTPGPLRSNPQSSSALDGSMYGAYADDPALRGRSPSMADSIISHMSSLDYNRPADPFADDFSYVPCFAMDDARRTFRDTVLGLEYLHYEGIIHRDIKPANLLWTRDHRTKISDFGVSYFGRPIRLGDGDDGVSESEAHDFDNDLELAKTVGTPAFFAPELCYTDVDTDYPQPKITEQIDVWSLGVTLYCLIFARIPFLAEDEWQMFRKIATEEVYIPKRRLRPVDPSTKPDEKSLYTRVNGPPYRDDDELAYEEIDPDLQNLLSRMLTKHPDKRIRLRDVKRHPWVLQGIDNRIGWLEDTDVVRRTSGGKIQVDEREMARAVIPLTLLERARSAVKKAVGKVMHSRTPDRTESSSRRRAASSAASSSGEPLTNPPTPVSRDNRRRSLRGDDYFAGTKESPQQQSSDHPLSQSVTASPRESPVVEGPGVKAAAFRREGSGGLALRQPVSEVSASTSISREEAHVPQHRMPRHSQARSMASAVLTLSGASRESYTVPPTPLHDSATDDPSSAPRRARGTRRDTADDSSTRARSVDRGLFASADKRAEPQVALTTAVAPGVVELPRPTRPIRLANLDQRSEEWRLPLAPSVPSPSTSRASATYQHGQPRSAPNIHARQRPSLGLEQLQQASGTTQNALMGSSDSVATTRPDEPHAASAPPGTTTIDPATIPCPPSPEQEVAVQGSPLPHSPSRTDTIGTLMSSKNTSMGTIPTPLSSPSETSSPLYANSSGPSSRDYVRDRDAVVEQILAFQSDPSLPALLSGASSVSADPEGEFLGGPGAVVKPSMIDTTESLTPPALAKDPITTIGSPLEQQDLVADGDGAITVEIDEGVARAPMPATPRMKARVVRDEDDDDDNSDSDEGLTMAKSRKKPAQSHSHSMLQPQSSPKDSSSGSTAERLPIARRRDTNISIASTETAKKVGPSD